MSTTTLTTTKGNGTAKGIESKVLMGTVPPLTKPKQKKEEKIEDVKPETVKQSTPPEEPKKILSIEELKNKTSVLEALSEKHDSIKAKIEELKKFKVLHEESEASISIEDVNGLSFESSNPRVIAQVIELWKQEFATAKADIETKMQEVYNN